MTKIVNAAIMLCLLTISGEISFGQENKKEISRFSEGAIIAYQKKERYSVTPALGGIATPVEFWIVRIDKWAEGAGRQPKYILVRFNLYERAVSDSEINSNKLRFNLRERRADEHLDCLGSITGNRRYAKDRAVRLSDYQRTNAGSADKIPPLKSLPCFIADEPPVVVEGKR